MAAETHTVGSRVWVKDADESWIKGEVQRLEDGLVVKTEKGSEVKAKPEDLPLQNPDARGVEVRSWQGWGSGQGVGRCARSCKSPTSQRGIGPGFIPSRYLC